MKIFTTLFLLLATSSSLMAAALLDPVVAAELSSLDERQFPEGVADADRYYSRDTRYSIVFPSHWALVPDTDATTLAGISPQEGDGDDFMENVLVGSFELGVEASLDDYFQGNLLYLQENVKDLEVVNVEEVSLDGIKAVRLVYISTIEGLRVKTLQVFTLKDGRGYIVTAMAMESSFDRFLPIFDWVISSFRFE